MINVIKPHCENSDTPNTKKIFLAGTIDNGNSEDWQSEFINWYIDTNHIDTVIYNPRRNPGCGFDASNISELRYQINWELKHLDESDVIIMNLLANSKSPISLLELGLYHYKMYVICPPEFYRYENVKITCRHFHIPFFESMEEFKQNFIE